MGLLGRRRHNIDTGWVRGSGLPLLLDRIEQAINDDGFLFILIVGERGKGKSSLAINLSGMILGEENIIDSLAFTIDDLDSKITSPPDNIVADDGRIKLLFWDDIGLHFSTYNWFTPHQRQRMQEFIENFQTIREDIAVLVGTAVETEILPPKIRGAANILIDTQRRGKGKVFGYTRYLWFRKWKVVGELQWGPPNQIVYNEYKKMKKMAHKAKQRSRLLSRTKLAKVYLDVLNSMDGDLDISILYGLGIVDIRGRLTDFGKYILSKANEDLTLKIQLIIENTGSL